MDPSVNDIKEEERQDFDDALENCDEEEKREEPWRSGARKKEGREACLLKKTALSKGPKVREWLWTIALEAEGKQADVGYFRSLSPAGSHPSDPFFSH